MKYYGKEKCKILKQIRAEIARQNNIEWVVSECKHQGNCRGTCPKCEAEVRELEAALARREALGKKVAVVGISAGIALSASGCANPLQPLGGEPLPPQTGEGNPNAAGNSTESHAVSETVPSLEGEILAGEEVLMGDIYIPPESETWEELDGVPLPGEEPTKESETATDPDEDTDMNTDTDEETWDGVFMGEPMPDEHESESEIEIEGEFPEQQP